MDVKDNRAAVWNFFKDNPCHSRLECAAALGLHRNTVDRHATAIREGWRPDGGDAGALALIRLASPDAFFVASGSVDPECHGRMIYASEVASGASLADAERIAVKAARSHGGLE
tara:strand:- start:19886 stop:20227 length:342 start_codon:yes stop_codon:yes gene_type:complete